MTENTNAPKPEENKPAAPSHEDELRAELERERGKGRLMKIAAAVLLGLFLIVAGVAIFVYRRVAAPIVAAQSALQGLARPQSANYGGDGEPQPFAAPGPQGQAGMPASSLGLFAGSLAEGQASPQDLPKVDPEKADRMMKVFAKYAQEPVAKELLEELRADPAIAKAMAAGDGGNPLQMVMLAQRSGSAQKIVAKYATRPDFLKLMMRLMKEPELRDLMKDMPGGMPQAPQPGTVPTQASQPQQPQEEGDMTFDASVISGQQPPASKTPAAKVPPPVDSE